MLENFFITNNIQSTFEVDQKKLMKSTGTGISFDLNVDYYRGGQAIAVILVIN